MPRLSDEQVARILLIVTAVRVTVDDDTATPEHLEALLDALEEELPVSDLESIMLEVAERRAVQRDNEQGFN